MTIQEITDDEVVQRCVYCGRENRTARASLQAGLPGDPRVIALPACECGAEEFLMRSPEDEPEHPAPGSRGHRHRLLVDHLHSELVRRGRVADRVAGAALTDRSIDGAAMQRWFPNGLKIDWAEGP